MTTNSQTIEILDPRLELVPEEIGISSDLPSLKGKVIGLLENRKYHADVFLEELEQVLTTDYQADKVVYRNKFSFSAACSDETINELTEQCDAIIHAIADWGSCTAWGLHDTVVTESRGIPSVSVITSNFTKAAYARATSLGMPGVRIVVLPSPLTPKSIPEVKQMAHDYAGEIVGLLTST